MDKKAEILLKEDEAFAIYSMPGSIDHTLIKGHLRDTNSDQPSFVIRKFDKKDERPLFLTGDQILHNPSFGFKVSENCTHTSTKYSTYRTMAEETICAIETGLFEKIVLSKIIVVEWSQQSLQDLFLNVKSGYPDAFVFLYNIPGEGCWCGASPEVLMQGKNGSYETMALAGTQPDHNLPLDSIKWGIKEIREQGIIEEYLSDALNRMNIPFEKSGPQTITTGQVLHILSTFHCSDVRQPLVLAENLHPGPAIGGMPQKEAVDFINKMEIHSRDHYCGYLGPWEIEKTNGLFINLRSMRVFRNHCVLYVGGGLTKNSKIEDEWNETELKAQTLLSIIEQPVVS